MTSSQLRHLVVIVYKWKRSDNESEERRGQFKVPGKFAPYVSYHRPGRNSARMESGERRVTANGRPERAPPRRGLCAIGVLYFVSILDNMYYIILLRVRDGIPGIAVKYLPIRLGLSLRGQ